MGISGISVWQLVVVLVIVIVLFGTKRLRDFGGDLGHSIKSLRDAVKPDKEEQLPESDKLNDKHEEKHQ